VGAMEIVAMDMKLRGMYIARQLSFHGVGFKIEEVALSKDFVKVYDESVKLVSSFVKLCMCFDVSPFSDGEYCLLYWDVMLCSFRKYRHFGETFCLHFVS
jgi:hypothetical protein